MSETADLVVVGARVHTGVAGSPGKLKRMTAVLRGPGATAA